MGVASCKPRAICEVQGIPFELHVLKQIVLKYLLSYRQVWAPIEMQHQHKLVTNLLNSKVTSRITNEERRFIADTSRTTTIYTPAIKKGKDKKTRATMKKDWLCLQDLYFAIVFKCCIFVICLTSDTEYCGRKHSHPKFWRRDLR